MNKVDHRIDVEGAGASPVSASGRAADEYSVQLALAAVLRRPELYPVLVEHLPADVIRRDRDRRIRRAMDRCAARGLPADVVTVRAELECSGELPDVTAPYLMSIESGLLGIPAPRDCDGLIERCQVIHASIQDVACQQGTPEGPIDEILRACDLHVVPCDLPMDAIERRLVTLRDHPDVRGADVLRRRLIRTGVVRVLEAAGIRGAAILADAALAVEAAPAAVAPGLALGNDEPWSEPVDGAAAGISPLGEIVTEREARDIKLHLAIVTDDVRERIAHGEEPVTAVAGAISKVRDTYGSSHKRAGRSNRVIENTVRAATNIATDAFDVDLVDFNALDQRCVVEWARELRQAARELTKLAARLERSANLTQNAAVATSVTTTEAA